jgi:SAM-dependent methyltransferase
MIDRLLKSVRSRIRGRRDPPRPGEFAADDFDWRSYNREYRGELKVIEKQHTLRLASGDYLFEGGALRARSARLPLHPNHRLLYETVLQLAPKSVMEVGCGGGDHLHNLALLAPALEIHGADRSEEQLRFLRERSPHLRADLRQLDATLPFSEGLPRVDLCYTQAVIMHIKTGNGHLVALANLFRMAARQVVLMENWRSHSFVGDVRFLHDRRMIPWKELHCYFRRAPELGGRPHLMVASATRLDYEPLGEDRVLVSAMGE